MISYDVCLHGISLSMTNISIHSFCYKWHRNVGWVQNPQLLWLNTHPTLLLCWLMGFWLWGHLYSHQHPSWDCRLLLESPPPGKFFSNFILVLMDRSRRGTSIHRTFFVMFSCFGFPLHVSLLFAHQWPGWFRLGGTARSTCAFCIFTRYR